jgi:hypothetical protein
VQWKKLAKEGKKRRRRGDAPLLISLVTEARVGNGCKKGWLKKEEKKGRNFRFPPPPPTPPFKMGEKGRDETRHKIALLAAAAARQIAFN